MQTITKSILNKVHQKRKEWVHKGQFGKLAIIGGSNELTGSCCFAAMAAYRAGCDVVYVIAPERAADVAANFSPNIITVPLKGRFLAPEHLSTILNAVNRFGINAVVLGPGIGRENATVQLVHQFIAVNNLPTIIDADGIRAFAAAPLKLDKKKIIFTPHAGEFLALTKTTLSNELEDRTYLIEKAAKHLNATILAKGHIDIISDGKNTVLNKTGSPFMTKGGMGDTLAGITGAYLARGINAFTAACAAAYVNGAAGAHAVKKCGKSVLATDLIEAIPNVI